MWTCPNSTGQRSVAWEFSDRDMPLDWGNPAVAAWELLQYACGCYTCPCPAGDAGGYNAIAVDGYHFANFGKACGHYDRDWTDKNAKFVTQYTIHKSTGAWKDVWGDPRYTRDAKLWLSRFYSGLQAMPAADRPLLILNFDLALCKEGGCKHDDPLVYYVGNHSDGQIDEGAMTWGPTGGVVRPEAQPAWLWATTLEWAANLQRAGKAYYPIVESLNCTAPQQSAVVEDDTTLSAAYWRWYLASYLLAKGDASALYISPVFADAPLNRQHTVTMTYGQIPWYLNRYRQASAVGVAAAPMVWQGNSSVSRRFTQGFVAANAHSTDTAAFPLPAGHVYRDVTVEHGGKQVQGSVIVPARNATVLLLVSAPASSHRESRQRKTDDGTEWLRWALKADDGPSSLLPPKPWVSWWFAPAPKSGASHAWSTSGNATAALALLQQNGGSAVATSLLLYCGDSISANDSFREESNPACERTATQVRSMDIGAERVIQANGPQGLSSLRTAHPVKS
jgi:hypothetical protein